MDVTRKIANAKIAATALAFILAPAFTIAGDTPNNSLVGTVCLVRVYHTNFKFPPEGGQIVTLGNEMFFWRNYLPECSSYVPSAQPAVASVNTYSAPTYNSYVPAGGTISGAFPQQIVGDPCAVRVYHANFRFPPEGGKIVKYGDELYFIRDYKPGCESAGSDGVLVVASGSQYNPLQNEAVKAAPTPAYVNPYYSPTAAIQTTSPRVAPTTCY